MAVNIMNRKFPKLEHHRNPSGCFNKANWLLEQSKRNQNKVHELVTSRILIQGYGEKPPSFRQGMNRPSF